MPYDYSIKPPCSSAKEVKDESGKVLGYTNVGCPAVILNTSNMLCMNGWGSKEKTLPFFPTFLEKGTVNAPILEPISNT